MVQPHLKFISCAISGCFILLIWSLFCHASAKSDNMAEMGRILNRYSSHYKNMDIEGILSDYSPEPDIIAIGPGREQRSRGPEEVRRAYKRELANYKKINSLEIKTVSVSSLGHVAWISADVFGKALLTSGSPTIISGRLTAVMKKVGRKWLLMQTHFSVPIDGPQLVR